MIKYQGIVTDRLNRDFIKKTKFYTTYRDASAAANKLCEKHFLEGRGNIHVEPFLQ
jgi:hypothetical protein